MIVRRLKGMGVALITPFKSDGSVDYNALVRLVEYQVQNGVDFLCVLGTTADWCFLILPASTFHAIWM